MLFLHWFLFFPVKDEGRHLFVVFRLTFFLKGAERTAPELLGALGDSQGDEPAGRLGTFAEIQACLVEVVADIFGSESLQLPIGLVDFALERGASCRSNWQFVARGYA